MSNIIEQTKPVTAATHVNYTICPVFVPSNVAVELGWLEEELKKVGAKLHYLFTSREEKQWLPHFTHKLDNLFRDGGNIPSIWAKADNTNTKLVGLTWSPHGGHVVARAASGIARVGDLKGKRIALYKSGNQHKVDWWRATGELGILNALKVAELSRKDVEITDIADDEDQSWGAGTKPAEVWASRPTDRALGVEVQALREGRVDALYTSQGRALALQESGDFTIIEDLGRYPDWTLQVNNSPYALTVNADLAEKRPEIVVAYLRAAIRAARWINANRDAAATLLHRVTFYPSVAATAKAIANYNFLPDLSPRNVAAIGITKRFLLEHGYIKNDFDVKSWVDSSFLEEAEKSL